MMSADRTDGTPTQGQLDRSERGMLRWTRIVGLFTIVLAILAGVQAYSFIESERAFLTVQGVDFANGEPTIAPHGLSLVVTLKNVGKAEISCVIIDKPKEPHWDVAAEDAFDALRCGHGRRRIGKSGVGYE
jgi:hypothetical protein